MRSYEKWGRIQRVRHENAQDRQGFEGEPTRVFLLKKGEKATPSQLATHGDATEALAFPVDGSAQQCRARANVHHLYSCRCGRIFGDREGSIQSDK